MVFQVPSEVISSLPIPMMSTREYKPRYSLFKRIDNHWFQVRVQTHTIECAYHVWIEFILNKPSEYSIRRASFDCNEAK